jgi:hypothetical protein
LIGLLILWAVFSGVEPDARAGQNHSNIWDFAAGEAMKTPALPTNPPSLCPPLCDSNNVAGAPSGPRHNPYILPESPLARATRPAEDGKNFWWQQLTDGGYQVPFGANVNTLKPQTATPLSYEDEHTFLGLGLGSTGLKPKVTGDLVHPVADRDLLESGVVYRHFLNRPDSVLSPYLSAGANLQTMVSSYRTAAAAGANAVNSGSLWGMDSYTGLGLALARTNRLSIFGEADLGHTTFQPQNQQLPNNDVLGGFGYLGLKAGLNFKF